MAQAMVFGLVAFPYDFSCRNCPNDSPDPVPSLSSIMGRSPPYGTFNLASVDVRLNHRGDNLFSFIQDFPSSPLSGY